MTSAIADGEPEPADSGYQARPIGASVCLVVAAAGSFVAWANWYTPPSSSATPSPVTSLTTVSVPTGLSTGRGTLGLVMGLAVLLAVVAVLTTRGRLRIVSAGAATLACVALLIDAITGLIAGISALASWGNAGQLGQFGATVQSGIFTGAILPSVGALLAAIIGLLAGLYLFPYGIRAAIRDLSAGAPGEAQHQAIQMVAGAEASNVPDQSPAAAATQVAAAGWYPDPTHLYTHRWWDGTQWTDQVGPPVATGPTAATPPETAARPATAPASAPGALALARVDPGGNTEQSPNDQPAELAPEPPTVPSLVITPGPARTLAWLTFGLSALILVVVPMFVISAAIIVALLALALFTALGPKAGREFRNLAKTSWKAVTWVVVAGTLLLVFGVLAGTGALPAVLTGIITFVLVLLFAVAFWTSVAGLFALPILGILCVLAVVSKTILTALFHLTTWLASGILFVLSAPTMLFGGRLSKTAKAARATLPAVTTKIRCTVSTYLARAAGTRPIVNSSVGGPPVGSGM